MSRHRVGAKRRPMTGSGGASSKRRPIGSATAVSGNIGSPAFAGD